MLQTECFFSWLEKTQNMFAMLSSNDAAKERDLVLNSFVS
jgi:hypothetical protein